MKDLTILHLSDLHIDEHFYTVNRQLINDSKSMLKDDDNIVICVTGDVIDKGNEKAIDNAKAFFEKLKKAINKEIKGIYFVPGNHDKKRTELNRFLIPAYRSAMDVNYSYNDCEIPGFNENFADALWQYQEDTYKESGYYDLLEYVYTDVFKECSRLLPLAQRTYGIDDVELEGYKYRFILLNTAWCCIDDKDTRHQILGDFQLDEIENQFGEKIEDEVDITIAMGHHPLECLCAKDQDALFNNCVIGSVWNVNMFLCGHEHDRKIINWSNNTHLMHTLMTGVGWRDTNKNQHDHFYSIYRTNIENNSLNITVRKWKNAKKNNEEHFEYDYSIYGERDVESIHKPIMLEDNSIRVSGTKENEWKAIAESKKVIDCLKMYAPQFASIAVEACDLMEDYKAEFLDKIEISDEIYNKYNYSKNEALSIVREFMYDRDFIEDSLVNESADDSIETDNQINAFFDEVFEENKTKKFECFDGFIWMLCDAIEEKLRNLVKDEECIIRTHFRYLSRILGDDKLYPELANSLFTELEAPKELYKLSIMTFSDLIKAIIDKGDEANNKSGCMIYSVNDKICQRKLVKWDDFITVIPNCDNLFYEKNNDNGELSVYPYLTFGVSISNIKCNDILYCMDFCSFEDILGDILSRMISAFRISLDEFCIWKDSDCGNRYEKR